MGDSLEQFVDGLTEAQAASLFYDWSLWARPNQLPPPGVDWFTWLILAGRGYGKTRTGAEWVRSLAEGKYTHRIALVAPTAADVRDTMVEGESGILAVSPPNFRPIYRSSKRRLDWPNGVRAYTYSADEPERLRGPQHGAAWCDEVASWRYPIAMDMLDFGLRLGKRPIKAITTTPKATKFVRELVKLPHTVLVKGSTYDNLSNLAPTFKQQIIDKYEGTRLGLQELHAEILEESEGALWKRDWIDRTRVNIIPPGVSLTRIVVAVDPATTSNKNSDETGISAQGRGDDHRGYVLGDFSLRGTPDAWAQKAIDVYHELGADCIVAEGNNGGDLVKSLIHSKDGTIPVHIVYASKGKYARAEPISMLYEQNKISHVGYFPMLEDQMCVWDPKEDPNYSPDRMDSLVWGLSSLFKTAPPKQEDFQTSGNLKSMEEFMPNDESNVEESESFGVSHATTPDW